MNAKTNRFPPGFIVFISVLVIVTMFEVGYVVQQDVGIQIPGKNSFTGDNCGIVLYQSHVYNFRAWRPWMSTGFIDGKDTNILKYSIVRLWGSPYTTPDGKITVFGMGFVDAMCDTQTGVVDIFETSLEKITIIRMPFTLP
jgi:hypothetical protein